jgi:hypothetical protein
MSVDEFPWGLTLRVHPHVGRALQGHATQVLEEVKTVLDREVSIKTDGNLHQEKFELVPKKRAGSPR